MNDPLLHDDSAIESGLAASYSFSANTSSKLKDNIEAARLGNETLKSHIESLSPRVVKIPSVREMSIGAAAMKLSDYATFSGVGEVASKMSGIKMESLGGIKEVHTRLKELHENTHTGLLSSSFYKEHVLSALESNQKSLESLSANAHTAFSRSLADEMAGIKLSSGIASSIGIAEKMFHADNLLSAFQPAGISEMLMRVRSASSDISLSHLNFMSAAERMFANLQPKDPNHEKFIRLSSTEYFNEALAIHEYFHSEPESITDRKTDTIVNEGKTTLIEEITVETNEVILSKLPSVDTDLLKLWEGAKLSLQSSNPDRTRHASVSLREILTTILHKKAPNENIKEWSNDPSHYDKKKPTRRARLEYITRDRKDGRESDFIKADIKATLELIDLFHQNTHSIHSTEDDANSLQILLQRAGGTIAYLLQI